MTRLSPKGVKLPRIMPPDLVLVRDCDHSGGCKCIPMAGQVLQKAGVLASWFSLPGGDLLFVHQDDMERALMIEKQPSWLFTFNVYHEAIALRAEGHPRRFKNPRCITIIWALGRPIPTPAIRFKRRFIEVINQRGQKRRLQFGRWVQPGPGGRRWLHVLDE